MLFKSRAHIFSGVGHQTAKRLQTLGLVSVKDLQVRPLSDLVKEFGGPAAQRLKNLALGVDDSPVTCTGAPQVSWNIPELPDTCIKQGSGSCTCISAS